MQKSKLITLLKTFSEAEFKEFEKFISASYFNKGRNYLPLYKALKPFHPSFDNPKFTEENIFKKIYPKQKYDNKKLSTFRSMISRMNELAFEYITYNGLIENKAFKDAAYLKELRTRKLNNLFTSAYKIITKDINLDNSGQNYFLRKFFVDTEKEIFFVEDKNKSISKYLESQKSTEDSLILFFLSELIRHVQSRKMNYDKNAARSDFSISFYESFNYDKFLNLIKNSTSSENILISILYYSAKLDNDFNDSESYENLKTLLAKHKNSLNIGLFYSAASRLMNCGLFQNKGNVSYYKNDYLNFYEVLLMKALTEKNLNFMSNTLLNSKAVYNCVKICIKQNQLNRLDNFIKSYSKYFQPEIKKDAVIFSEGSLEFAKGNYEKSLSILSKSEFTIPMIVKEIKIMKMKSCYELDCFDLLFGEIDTYRHYLSTTSGIPEDSIDSDRIFLKLLRRLAKLKETPNQDDISNLKTDISKLKYKTFHTDWIIEKVNIISRF
ncbi:MAG: hypothetical protein IT280_11850 [Ignavibacteria bacterium]|nr:hypothetical protein [Ignavibacteria bacterium]